MRTLEDILVALGTEKPFLGKIKILEDGTIQPFTPEGAEAYKKLTDILFCIGNITDMEPAMALVVDELDEIANMDD